MFLCLIAGVFKNASMTARCRFVVSRRLCWRCLREGHVARGCPDKRIKVCDRYSHCEIACPCDYHGKKSYQGPLLLIALYIVFAGKEGGFIYLFSPLKSTLHGVKSGCTL